MNGGVATASSSGVLSSPSYTLLEREDGRLTTGLEEKVTWPQRPVFGRYSEIEEIKSRRQFRGRKKGPESARSVQSDVLVAPWMVPDKIYHDWTNSTTSRSMCMIPSEMFGIGDEDNQKSFDFVLDTKDFGTVVEYENSQETTSGWNRKQQDSDLLIEHEFLPGVDVSTARSTPSEPSLSDGSSIESKKGETFGVLGVCTRVDAMEELNKVVAVLFYEMIDDSTIPLRMGFKVHDRKYVITVVADKMEKGELAWRLESKGETKPSFRSQETLVHFYSIFPEAAGR